MVLSMKKGVVVDLLVNLGGNYVTCGSVGGVGVCYAFVGIVNIARCYYVFVAV